MLTALLLALLVGCGSGEENSAPASRPLTKAEFIKRSSEICESEDTIKERRLAAASSHGNGYFHGSQRELTQLVSQVILPFYGELIKELADLNPPVGERGKVKRIVADYEKTLKEAEADPKELVTNDIFLRPNRVAIKYGIKNCTL